MRPPAATQGRRSPQSSREHPGHRSAWQGFTADRDQQPRPCPMGVSWRLRSCVRGARRDGPTGEDLEYMRRQFGMRPEAAMTAVWPVSLADHPICGAGDPAARPADDLPDRGWRAEDRLAVDRPDLHRHFRRHFSGRPVDVLDVVGERPGERQHRLHGAWRTSRPTQAPATNSATRLCRCSRCYRAAHQPCVAGGPRSISGSCPDADQRARPPRDVRPREHRDLPWPDQDHAPEPGAAAAVREQHQQRRRPRSLDSPAQTFIAAPFEAQVPPQTEGGEPTVTIVVSNVDRVVEEYLSALTTRARLRLRGSAGDRAEHGGARAVRAAAAIGRDDGDRSAVDARRRPTRCSAASGPGMCLLRTTFPSLEV